MVDYKKHIISKPEIMLGKPCIIGTRITVESILKRLSEGISIKEILKAYPHLTRIQILSCNAYAADVIGNEELITG